MMKIPMHVLTRSVVIAVLVSMVVSCGGKPSVEAIKRDPIPVPATALQVKGAPGTYGGTLTVALPDDIETFNPYYQSNRSTVEVLRQLYAPLVGFNAVTGKAEPQSGLAQSFEAVGKKVTIKLRDGIKFSDGKVLTADDVVYSFKVAFDADIKAPLLDMFTVNGRLPEVKKVDQNTVDLEFTEPYPAIGYVLSQMPIISAGADAEATIDKGRYEEALGITTAPNSIACTGPYRVMSYDKGKLIKLIYNPHYWKIDSQNQRLPYIDYVDFKVASSDEAIKGLQDGTISLATYIPATKLAPLGTGTDKIAIQDLGPGYGTWELFGNMDVNRNLIKVQIAWLLNPKFREFLSKTIDREAIAKNVFGGKATAIYGPVTPGNQTWTNANVKKFPFDGPDALKALGNDFHVSERDGKPQLFDIVDRSVKFKLYHPKTEMGEEMAKAVAGQLGKNGILIEPVAVESSRLLSEILIPGKFELAIWRQDGFGPDPISYMPVFMQDGKKHFFLTTPAGGTGPFEWEQTIGRLMRSQQDKTLDQERQADFNKAQTLWCENNPVVYIVADNVLIAADKSLGNFQPVAIHPYATWNSDLLFFKQ